MGAPKQKWTSEEEAALKAGITKHGPGKWRTILKDPEFSGVLSSRSNVDLKDKWRNMGVTANGFGTRDKARLALKKNKVVFKPEENSLALSTVVQCEEEIIDANDAKCHGKEGPKTPNTKPQKNLFQEAEIPQEAAAKKMMLSEIPQEAASKKMMLSEIPQEAASKKTIPRLDTIILEAITNLKEPTGSNRVAIATYIEDRYFAPLNFKRVLTAKLALLTTSGKLIKVKRKYRIAPSSFCSEENKSSGVLLMEEKQKDSPTGPSTEKDDIKILTKAQIDAELSKMRNMTAQEAAVAAARAVAEAEAALAEAEEAEKEAEAAEADAEAAQAFAEAAMTTLKNRNTSKLTAVHA